MWVTNFVKKYTVSILPYSESDWANSGTQVHLDNRHLNEQNDAWYKKPIRLRERWRERFIILSLSGQRRDGGRRRSRSPPSQRADFWAHWRDSGSWLSLSRVNEEVASSSSNWVWLRSGLAAIILLAFDRIVNLKLAYISWRRRVGLEGYDVITHAEIGDEHSIEMRLRKSCNLYNYKVRNWIRPGNIWISTHNFYRSKPLLGFVLLEIFRDFLNCAHPLFFGQMKRFNVQSPNTHSAVSNRRYSSHTLSFGKKRTCALRATLDRPLSRVLHRSPPDLPGPKHPRYKEWPLSLLLYHDCYVSILFLAQAVATEHIYYIPTRKNLTASRAPDPSPLVAKW